MKPKELTFEEIKLKTLFRDLDSFQMPKGYHQKIYAIRDMIIVANGLNGDWKPDWDNGDEQKFRIAYDFKHNVVSADFNLTFSLSICHFKSSELAHQAIKILGEEKIKLALS